MAEETEQSLDEVLTDAPVEETPEESTAEQTDAPAASPTPSPEQAAAVAQARDERRKRQELQRELADIRSKLDAKDAPARPSVLDDEDAAFSHLQQNVQSTIVNERINMSREFMLSMKDDYEEHEDEFLDMAADNPSLRDEMAKHPMPAKFVYETAQKRRELAAMDNIDEVKAKMRAELKAELLAELKGEFSTKAETAEAASRVAEQPSLAQERSTSDAENTSDESLEDILKR